MRNKVVIPAAVCQFRVANLNIPHNTRAIKTEIPSAHCADNRGRLAAFAAARARMGYKAIANGCTGMGLLGMGSRFFFKSGMSLVIVFVIQSLDETNAPDKAAGALCEGISFREGLPESGAVVGMDGVDEFMGDDVIDHPGRPVLDLIADADMALGRTAGRTAPQAGLHVAHPADGFPLKLTPKIFAVDIFRATL